MDGEKPTAAWQLRPRILKLDSGGEKYLSFAKQQLLRMYQAGVYGIRQITMPDGAVVQYRRQPGANSDWISITNAPSVTWALYGDNATSQKFRFGTCDKDGNFTSKLFFQQASGAFVYAASKAADVVLFGYGTGTTFAPWTGGVLYASTPAGGGQIAVDRDGKEAAWVVSNAGSALSWPIKQVLLSTLTATPPVSLTAAPSATFGASPLLDPARFNLGLSTWTTVSEITTYTIPPSANTFTGSTGRTVVMPAKGSASRLGIVQYVTTGWVDAYSSPLISFSAKHEVFLMRAGVVTLASSRTSSMTRQLVSGVTGFSVTGTGYEPAQFAGALPSGATELSVSPPVTRLLPDGRVVTVWHKWVVTGNVDPYGVGLFEGITYSQQLELEVNGVVKGTLVLPDAVSSGGPSGASGLCNFTLITYSSDYMVLRVNGTGSGPQYRVTIATGVFEAITTSAISYVSVGSPGYSWSSFGTGARAWLPTAGIVATYTKLPSYTFWGAFGNAPYKSSSYVAEATTATARIPVVLTASQDPNTGVYSIAADPRGQCRFSQTLSDQTEPTPVTETYTLANYGLSECENFK